MIFEETISLPFSILGISIFILFIFSLIFYHSRKNIIRSLYKTPSIIFLGPKLSGKTTMIKEITKKDVIPHIKDNDIHVSYLDNGKKIQFVEPQNFHPENKNIIRKMKEMNAKSFVYMFDVSHFSDKIENQIKMLNEIQNLFNNMNCIVVANKIDIANKKKLKKIKSEFKNVHEVSLYNKNGLKKLKNSIFSSVKDAKRIN